MTIKAAGLISQVRQMWVAFGSCPDEKRQRKFKRDAYKAELALRNYISKLESELASLRAQMEGK